MSDHGKHEDHGEHTLLLFSGGTERDQGRGQLRTFRPPPVTGLKDLHDFVLLIVPQHNLTIGFKYILFILVLKL